MPSYPSFRMEIVARIDEEQKLVDANKKLIEIFKGKIKEKIAVWGIINGTEKIQIRAYPRNPCHPCSIPCALGILTSCLDLHL